MKNQTIESELLFAKNALINASNVELVSKALEIYNYGPEKLKEGLLLEENASSLQEKQKKEYGEQFEATDALMTAKADANAVYMKHVKIARIALKNSRGAGESLQIAGRRKRSLSGWLNQAGAFYTNAISSNEAIEAFKKFNITINDLKQGKELIQGVAEKYHLQLKETGEAQAATKERDDAFDMLNDWMSDFIGIARIALIDKPQYLEILGIVEPS